MHCVHGDDDERSCSVLDDAHDCWLAIGEGGDGACCREVVDARGDNDTVNLSLLLDAHDRRFATGEDGVDA